MDMPPNVETSSISIPISERDDKFARIGRKPAHYVVEIKPVTELLTLDKYESCVFEAGGYEWSLCLKPKGGTYCGKEYMSMYLSIEEPNKLGDSGRVVVDYKFFVFDYNNEEYVTFKEKGKEFRAFSKAKPRWGLDKFLSLASFNNKETGFRQDDSCIFGAEVLVIKREKETFTIIKEPPDNKITMEIPQFSTSTENLQWSGDFTLGAKTWKLCVSRQPRGDGKGNSLSVSLQAQELPPRIKMYVEAKLSVLNNKDRKNDKEQRVRGWLSANNCSCGHRDFMSWADLCERNGWFVVSNNKKRLKIVVQILVISSRDD